ncbi:TetR/AcrR family transcriptional regulator [Parageobacillus thermoglucosidasius]|nr:TetR/AcrR family transcriptional regulator [Parageobacillus thermoglucosidasius]AEH48775.1 transcriptional regulator, TetR family [Parageobacillus thermoglucosidasius C56-YS93]MED4903310.1 TetR/AcrR family transcriptional regulator [Parageobacillus thermoglucosidasius]MED4914612.1 TetR/AcrR family transcriptional regulator [Parageobacillus thermoglucosidasius]MED4946238.1 TetR/AcrR family transcriptional regulator [Parageobacillus thermoglucosidasius]MED4982580.1 TetR/AcrR family transcript
MEASIALFDENGFSETSVQDIVDALGVTKGTFYYYFKSKEELLMDIHLRYIEGLLEKQKKIIGDPAKTAKEKVLDIVYMLIHNIEKQGRQARVFFREMKHLNEEHLKKISEKRDMFRYGLQSLIEKGIKNGEFREDLHPSIAALTVLGAANWSYQWFRPDGELSDFEVAKQMVAILLEGMEKRSSAIG